MRFIYNKLTFFVDVAFFLWTKVPSLGPFCLCDPYKEPNYLFFFFFIRAQPFLKVIIGNKFINSFKLNIWILNSRRKVNKFKLWSFRRILKEIIIKYLLFKVVLKAEVTYWHQPNWSDVTLSLIQRLITNLLTLYKHIIITPITGSPVTPSPPHN